MILFHEIASYKGVFERLREEIKKWKLYYWLRYAKQIPNKNQYRKWNS